MSNTLLTGLPFIAAILLGLTGISLHADEVTHASPETIEIRTIDILPYGVKREKKTEGIYFDLANQLAAEAGYSANNYVAPYVRIIFELKSGQTDMSILFKYPELHDHVVYIAPLAPLRTVVISLKDTNIQSISALQGKTIGYLRGAKFSDAIDNDKRIKKLETTDFLQAVKMLIFGRVDAIIGPMDPIISAALELGKDPQLFGQPLTVAERTPWIQVSKKSLARISPERLNAAFNALKSRHMVEGIRQYYLAPRMDQHIDATPTADIAPREEASSLRNSQTNQSAQPQ